jgi:hypothetical protein
VKGSRQEVTSAAYVFVYSYVFVCTYLCIHSPGPSLSPKPRNRRQQTVPTTLPTFECLFFCPVQRFAFFITSWLRHRDHLFYHTTYMHNGSQCNESYNYLCKFRSKSSSRRRRLLFSFRCLTRKEKGNILYKESLQIINQISVSACDTRRLTHRKLALRNTPPEDATADDKHYIYLMCFVVVECEKVRDFDV